MHYLKYFKVEWVFYTSGAACLEAVLRGDCDMTDIYFLQGLPEEYNPSDDPSSKGAPKGAPKTNPPLMVQQFYRTCPVITSSNVFISKPHLRVKTFQDIIAYIRNHPDEAKVAYLTPANRKTLHFLLPPETPYVLSTSTICLSNSIYCLSIK